MAEWMPVVTAVLSTLGPVIARMVEKAMAGEDAISVLTDGRVADILPPDAGLEIAQAAARARRAAKG